MPGSAQEGKQQGLEFVLDLDLHDVLDVGPGRGTWYDLLHTFFPEARFHAIEIHEPYVARYGLRSKYREIIIGDAADPDLKLSPFADVDLAIFGDVVEHVERERAVAMVWRLPWRHALLSIPIGEYLQGPEGGNPHEAHVDTWSEQEVIDTFRPIKAWSGPITAQPGHRIGVYLLERPF